ncbi:MAG: nuclear transport factor 2 family protein [Gammaproteobacteria bacterium]|nr:nuclear transport factor 2 family protein [Gammaproteobacteria bacterium]
MTPEQIVRDYLAAMEARDLERAGALLDAEFKMCFPGGICLTRLADLQAWAATRYRFVNKRYEGFDTLDKGERAIVYCRGVFNGEALDGTPIRDVRFIDRFELRHGRLIDQQVWNDLAEVHPQTK